MKGYNQEDYEKYLQDHKGEYETCLWSGSSTDENGVSHQGDENAREICEEHNDNLKEGEKPWKTNEMLLDEAGMEMPDYDKDNPESVEAWESASRTTAENAEGQAHVIKGEDGSYDSVYNKIEKPALRENDNVNQDVDIVDPASGQSKGSEQKTDLSPTEPKETGYSFGDDSKQNNDNSLSEEDSGLGQ